MLANSIQTAGQNPGECTRKHRQNVRQTLTRQEEIVHQNILSCQGGSQTNLLRCIQAAFCAACHAEPLQMACGDALLIWTGL